jgi:hypothetical protein
MAPIREIPAWYLDNGHKASETDGRLIPLPIRAKQPDGVLIAETGNPRRGQALAGLLHALWRF